MKAEMTHVEINVRDGKKKIGKLYISDRGIQWTPSKARLPIKKNWTEFQVAFKK